MWWKVITSNRIAGTRHLLLLMDIVSLYLEGFILTEAQIAFNYDCMNMYMLLSSLKREKLQIQHFREVLFLYWAFVYFSKFNLHINCNFKFTQFWIHEDLILWNFNFTKFWWFFTVIFYLDLSIYFIKSCLDLRILLILSKNV